MCVDSITWMVMVAFCDSQLFSEGFVKYKTKYIDFITQLVTKGITAYTYTDRAELIILLLNPVLQTLE